jgi:hypothetical protein
MCRRVASPPDRFANGIPVIADRPLRWIHFAGRGNKLELSLKVRPPMDLQAEPVSAAQLGIHGTSGNLRQRLTLFHGRISPPTRRR